MGGKAYGIAVVLFCDGRIVPVNDGFSAHLAGRIRVHREIGTRMSLVVTDRGWNDPIRLRQLSVPVDLVSPEQYYAGGAELAATIGARRPDVLVIPNPNIVLGVAKGCLARYRIVYEVHELVSDLAAQLGEVDREHSERILELAAARCADFVITFTEHDRLRFVEAGLDSDRVIARPCIPSMTAISASASRDSRRLVFLGNGFYEPNRRAIRFLGRELLPRLPRDVVLSIIGTHPDLPDLRADGRVCLLGPVEDLAPALQLSAIGLCPVWEATGIRMKIFDYGAAGLVTVAARAGLEGVPANPGIVGVASREGFIEAVLRLIASPEECTRRQRAAIVTFRNREDAASEAELLSLILRQPALDVSARRRIAQAAEVRAALSRWPQPRWLEETLQRRRFPR
jgi:Glycosyl transferases group 1